jgi:hypothetical protein
MAQPTASLSKRLIIWVPIVVALATAAISYKQVRDAHDAAFQQIASKDRELENLKAQQDREWKFKALDFVTTHSDVIFGPNSVQQTQIINVMTVAFPNDVTSVLFPKVQAIVTDPTAKEKYGKAAEIVSKPDRLRVLINYTSNRQANIQGLVSALNGAGYNSVATRLFNVGPAPTVSDVRYYYEIDAEFALDVQAIVNRLVGTMPRLNPRLDDQRSVNTHSPGAIEIWLT